MKGIRIAAKWTGRALLVAVVLSPLGLIVTGESQSQQRQAELVERERTRLRLSAYIDHKNPHKSRAEKQLLLEAILEESDRLRVPDQLQIDGHDINPAYFVTAVISVESTFYREAISSADARGYMQLMPDTAAWMDQRLTPDGRLIPEPVAGDAASKDEAAERVQFFAVLARSALFGDGELREQTARLSAFASEAAQEASGDDAKRNRDALLAELFDTRANIRRGVTYLNFLIAEMDDIRKASLAYNAGPGNVKRGFWVERYWLKILAAYREIESGAYLANDVRGI